MSPMPPIPPVHAPGAVRRPLAAAAVLVAVAGGLLPGPAQAQTTTPQLQVAVDNGRAETTAGTSSVYTVTVTNLGSSRLRNLRLSQTIPAGARLVSAGGHGRVTSGQVSWTLDLPAAGTRIVRTKLRVDATTPDTLLRLATVACVRTAADQPPVVCAADSDQLPAGEAAVNDQAVPSTAPAGRDPLPTVWPYVSGAAGVVLVAGAVAVVVRRRRRELTKAAGVGTPQ